MGFCPLSNGFSSRKHISFKSNVSVLTISGKTRNIKIIAPSTPFYYQPHLPPPILWYSLNIPWDSFYYDPPHFKIFFWSTHPPPTPLLIQLPPPPTINCRRVDKEIQCNTINTIDLFMLLKLICEDFTPSGVTYDF